MCRRIRTRRIILITISVLLSLPALELISRIYLVKCQGISFFSPSDALYWYYPQIKRIPKDYSQKNGTVRLLILSASHLASSGFNEMLRNDLSAHLHREVEIVNSSRSGYTSFDNDLLYHYYRDLHFDMVIFYNGLNELRANNCPGMVFRSDYSHFSNYSEINFLIKNRRLIRYFTLPYTLICLYRDNVPTWMQLLHIPRDVGRSLRMRGWTKHGADIKTARVFEAHLDSICSLARQKHEPVLILGLCTNIHRNGPAMSAVEQRDYIADSLDVFGYGDLGNVCKGLRAHDSVCIETAKKYTGTKYMNFCSLIPDTREYYRDPAHFTDEGLRVVAENLADSIAKSFEFQ